MTNLKNESNLTDDVIIEIAEKIDKLIFEIGDEYKPSGIEFASIALGRLMVFSKQVGCFEVFQQLLAAVVNMSEKEPLTKTDDIKE